MANNSSPPSTGSISLYPRSLDPQLPAPRLTKSSIIHPATKFVPFSKQETLATHFRLQTIPPRCPELRFVNQYNSREILLIIDGSCLNNGRVNPDVDPVAGASFMYKNRPRRVASTREYNGGADTKPTKPVTPGRSSAGVADMGTTFPFKGGSYQAPTGRIGFQLEKRNPGGDEKDHTSNQAKIRAAIAALDFLPWHEEGWKRVVVATDLEYVAKGATEWLPRWVENNWKGSKRKEVKNREWWEALQAVIERLYENGTEVSFWCVTSKDLDEMRNREEEDGSMVEETKKAAKEAAKMKPDIVPGEFTRLRGHSV